MKCPVDDEMLVMTERSGVEIDYCPKCRGIWLDRGELDKIIERSAGAAPQSAIQPSRTSADAPSINPRDDLRQTHVSHSGHHQQKRKKPESFLSELFDF